MMFYDNECTVIKKKKKKRNQLGEANETVPDLIGEAN